MTRNNMLPLQFMNNEYEVLHSDTFREMGGIGEGGCCTINSTIAGDPGNAVTVL